MNLNRTAVLFALLALLFFVSTSSGLADISAVQEQLRTVQLKLVGLKIKLLQEAITEVGKPDEVQQPVEVLEPVLSREELTQRIENQIVILESLITSLKPRALADRTAELEARIEAINQETKTATGERLEELARELEATLVDHQALQREVRDSLEVTLKERQVAVLQEQVNILQEKVSVLPHPALREQQPVGSDYPALRDQIEKAQLRLLQAKMKAIQEKIDELRAR